MIFHTILGGDTHGVRRGVVVRLLRIVATCVNALLIEDICLVKFIPNVTVEICEFFNTFIRFHRRKSCLGAWLRCASAFHLLALLHVSDFMITAFQFLSEQRVFVILYL